MQGDDGKTAWCCVVTGDYDRQLGAFLRSLREHCPDAPCTVFTVGPIPPLDSLAHLAEIVDLTPELRLSFKPGVPGAPSWISVVMACKPLVLLRMLAAGHRRVVFADADLWMLAPPVNLLRALRDAAVVLTPHVIARATSARGLGNDLVVLNAGTFNSGLVAVSGDEGRAFCVWWAERTLTLKDQPDGFASDQRWLNLVPHLFRDVVALNDPGTNVGHWRLDSDADVERNGDGYVVRGQPLSLLHMSGFDARRPSLLSKYAPDLVLREGSALRELAERYAGCLIRETEQVRDDR